MIDQSKKKKKKRGCGYLEEKENLGSQLVQRLRKLLMELMDMASPPLLQVALFSAPHSLPLSLSSFFMFLIKKLRWVGYWKLWIKYFIIFTFIFIKLWKLNNYKYNNTNSIRVSTCPFGHVFYCFVLNIYRQRLRDDHKSNSNLMTKIDKNFIYKLNPSHTKKKKTKF